MVGSRGMKVGGRKLRPEVGEGNIRGAEQTMRGPLEAHRQGSMRHKRINQQGPINCSPGDVSKVDHNNQFTEIKHRKADAYIPSNQYIDDLLPC